MLTPEERTSSGDRSTRSSLLLAINPGVPPLPSDISVSIAADTLLSDKFVLLSGGSSQAAPWRQMRCFKASRPPPLTSSLAKWMVQSRVCAECSAAPKGRRATSSIRSGACSRKLKSLAAAHPVVQDAQSLLTEAKPVVEDAKALTTDARQLIADNKEPISQAIRQLDKSAAALEKLATNGNNLVANNEKKLNAVISDFKVTSENLKVTSTYAKILIRSLSQRPSQLIWGTSKPPPLPSEQQI